MISTNFTPSASEARSTICVLADEYSWETVAKEMIHRMTGDEAREFVEDFQTNYSNWIMTVYTDNGFANRKAYLENLAEEYGKDLVETLTSVLPASEDFDGLVTSLEDALCASEWTSITINK